MNSIYNLADKIIDDCQLRLESDNFSLHIRFIEKEHTNYFLWWIKSNKNNYMSAPFRANSYMDLANDLFDFTDSFLSEG